ncbi:hypothetical protein [Paenibacillus camerounensis]|uniref:hypothetical protein n=1 Tax=Paenibacillus camerounensis TaxID=1243663 RepID=UPI0005A6AF3D|nr:hypothetical protein [Paenibacillus camerounensis]
MSRMSHAIYFNRKQTYLCALDVDGEFHKYEKTRDKFTCIFCGVKVQFSRGKEHNDPHFKNWPLTSHKNNCVIPIIESQKEKHENVGEVELLVSTILPRAKRLNSNQTNLSVNRSKKARVFAGKRSKKFIYSLINLLDNKNYFKIKPEFEELQLLIEDGSTIKLKELIGSQDEIIERIEQSQEKRAICILRGNTRSAQIIKNNIKIPLTKGNNPIYKNTNDFSLFISWDYAEKNKEFIKSIENSLIVCYGEATTNEFGTQIEVYSIKNQITLLKKYK